MKKLLILFCAVLALSSCKSTYYQICDIKSTAEKVNSQYAIEDESCNVFFNFWGESGDASFVFHNQTDRNIYIPLKCSSFVNNGFSRMMYENVDLTVINSKLSSKTYHSSPVICIAPHSSARVYDKTLVDKIYQFCQKKKDFPKRSYSESFAESESPMIFAYYINYSFNPVCDVLNTVYADFYISKIENIKAKYITTYKDVTDCNTYQSVSAKFLDPESPTRFYITKSKKNILDKVITPLDF